MRLALIFTGGGLGATARYLVGLWFVERFGSAFPWGTLSINVAGSLLIGVVATLADEAGVIGREPRFFLVAGILGGFTTFSSFALETLRLADGASGARNGPFIRAVSYPSPEPDPSRLLRPIMRHTSRWLAIAAAACIVGSIFEGLLAHWRQMSTSAMPSGGSMPPKTTTRRWGKRATAK